MLANFASESGKKAGEFYTPHQVSRLMAMIAMDGKEDKKGLTVYDPTLGFRVIIVIEANSYVNIRSSRLLPKLKKRIVDVLFRAVITKINVVNSTSA